MRTTCEPHGVPRVTAKLCGVPEQLGLSTTPGAAPLFVATIVTEMSAPDCTVAGLGRADQVTRACGAGLVGGGAAVVVVVVEVLVLVVVAGWVGKPVKGGGRTTRGRVVVVVGRFRGSVVVVALVGGSNVVTDGGRVWRPPRTLTAVAVELSWPTMRKIASAQSAA